MRYTIWLERTFYFTAVAALSLGLPVEAAFRYEMSHLVTESKDTDPQEGRSLPRLEALSVKREFDKTFDWKMDCHTIDSKRIHAPPLT